MNQTKVGRVLITGIFVACPMLASAHLAMTVSPPPITGQKAVVKVGMKNSFSEKIESARAAMFVTDPQGKMVGQTTQWVIGGTKAKPGLEPKKETTFNFVVSIGKGGSTNVMARVLFNRVILAGGKEADPVKDATIVKGAK
jgi:hypothetical protein